MDEGGGRTRGGVRGAAAVVKLWRPPVFCLELWHSIWVDSTNTDLIHAYIQYAFKMWLMMHYYHVRLVVPRSTAGACRLPSAVNSQTREKRMQSAEQCQWDSGGQWSARTLPSCRERRTV